ncbi:MAG: DUF6993 domain-containing protein [Agromyces sp.]
MKRLARLIESPFAFLVTLLVVVPLAAGIAAFAASGFRFAPDAVAASSRPVPTGVDEAGKALELKPKGDAIDNKKYFDYVNETVIAKKTNPVGRDFIDALVLAGFAKAAMQLTPGTTAVGLEAPSIQFSVQMNDTCLIGQWGGGSDGYQSSATKIVNGIGCLIGTTQPIDW